MYIPLDMRTNYTYTAVCLWMMGIADSGVP